MRGDRHRLEHHARAGRRARGRPAARRHGPEGVHPARAGRSVRTGRSAPRRWPRSRTPSRPRCGSPRSSTPRRSASSRRLRCGRPPTARRWPTEITRACGVPVEVLSEQEEGRLAFIGATRTLGHVVRGEVAVVDVGGGSTEIVLGTLREGVRSGALVQDRVRVAWPTASSPATLRRPPRSARCANTSRPSSTASRWSRPEQAVAVGGSATSLRWLVGHGARVRDPRARDQGADRRLDRRASPSASSSTRAGCGSCRRACCCWRRSPRLLALPAADRQGRAARRGDPGPADGARAPRVGTPAVRVTLRPMAKARPIPGLSAGDPYASGGGEDRRGTGR